MDEFIATHFLRSELAPGNLNPKSKFVNLDSLMNNLFYSDRPFHAIFCSEHNARQLSFDAARVRGVRAINWNLFNDDLPLDSNKRANQSAYFIGSMDEPYTPYILLSSTTNDVLVHYLRKFGMTTFSYEGYYAGADYELDYTLFADIITRAVYVHPSSYNLKFDLEVGPEVSIEEYESYLIKRAASISETLHVKVVPFAYQPALVRNGITSNLASISFSDLNKKSFVMTTYEGEIVLDKNEKVPFDMSRKFIVAPSGSGKTYWVSTHDDCVDADSLFEWPKTPKWWLDPELAEKVNKRNHDILVEWLSGVKDGKIAFYADTLGLMPDSAVLIPEDLHLFYLNSKNQPLQPGPEDITTIRESFKKQNISAPVFDSFSRAVSFVRTQGRNNFSRRHRFSWMFCYLVADSAIIGWNIQSYISVQTWVVKSITYAIAKILAFNNIDIEKPRRLALLRLKVVVLNHKRIGGLTKFRGLITPITVAGHMVNYVILSCMIPLDWNRFFQHIRWNIELYSGKRKLNVTEREFAKKDLFAELTTTQTVYNLWHNIIEWTIGVHAGVIFAQYLGFQLDYVLIENILVRLK